MACLLIVLGTLAAAVSAQPKDLKLSNAKAVLDRLENNIEAGVDKAIDAASAWNKTVLVDAALHTSKLNPCKTGYLADAAGKCTVCDFTLSMVPGCNACITPGTCSGCGEGYDFIAAANDGAGACICDVAHLNDPHCVQCTLAESCDQCAAGYFPDPTTKVCTQCTDDNCLVCDDATTCNVCAPRSALSLDGKACLACPAGCAQCHVEPFQPADADKAKAAGGVVVCDVCDSNLYECPTGESTISTCTNLLNATDSCGKCGNACPVDAVCSDGACACPAPDSTPTGAVQTGATCGQTYQNTQPAATYEYTGPYTVGDTFTVNYASDLLPIPTRYVVRANSTCGTVLGDTGFTGEWAYGCAASTPCCDAATFGGGCTGNSTGGGTADCTPGGGPAGTETVTLSMNVTSIYVTAYSACGDSQNANAFSLTCPS